MPPPPTTNVSGDLGVDLEFISGVELFAIVTVAGILAAAGVYIDGRRRGLENPAIWAATVGFLFLLYAVPGVAALVVYLLLRGEDPDRSP